MGWIQATTFDIKSSTIGLQFNTRCFSDDASWCVSRPAASSASHMQHNKYSTLSRERVLPFSTAGDVRVKLFVLLLVFFCCFFYLPMCISSLMRKQNGETVSRIRAISNEIPTVMLRCQAVYYKSHFSNILCETTSA